MLARTLARNLDLLGAAPADRLLVDPGVRLQIEIPQRQQDNWCWAAVAVGVAAAYGDTDPKWKSQCRVAKRVKNKPCCPAGALAKCDKPHNLPPALDDHHNPAAIATQDEKDFGFVKQQTDAGLPLAVRIEFSDGRSSHFVVISGYSVQSGIPHLWIYDPATGLEDHYQFDEFSLHFDKIGTWGQTFRTKGSTTGSTTVPSR